MRWLLQDVAVGLFYTLVAVAAVALAVWVLDDSPESYRDKLKAFQRCEYVAVREFPGCVQRETMRLRLGLEVE